MILKDAIIAYLKENYPVNRVVNRKRSNFVTAWIIYKTGKAISIRLFDDNARARYYDPHNPVSPHPTHNTYEIIVAYADPEFYIKLDAAIGEELKLAPVHDGLKSIKR